LEKNKELNRIEKAAIMTTINFVPNDYIQQRRSSRVNLLYLILLAILLAGIAATFSIIKMRQAGARAELNQLDEQMQQAREEIARLDQIKQQGRTMVKSMMMTAELLEPLPRSIVLACLTNMLPPGVSLLEVKLEEKENKVTSPAPAAAGKAAAGAKPAKPTQYQAAAAGKQAKQAPAEVRTVIQNDLVIEGIAHSDIEVASYIANLSGTTLLDNVQLIESKEQKIEDITYRQFRLRTSLKYNVTLTKDDINTIRKQREETI
jgi:Tfp pilus assembly protein PilN